MGVPKTIAYQYDGLYLLTQCGCILLGDQAQLTSWPKQSLHYIETYGQETSFGQWLRCYYSNTNQIYGP